VHTKVPITSSPSSTAETSRVVLRALWPVVVAALVAALGLMAGVRSRPAAIVRSVENGGDWYARSPGWFTSRGLYPTEHTPDGAAFAWAGGRVRLQIAQLDRRAPRELRLRVRSGRDEAAPPATIRVAVDGVDGRPATVGSQWQEIGIALPAARGRGATITLDAQDTFVPGPNDRRALGFVVDRLTLDAGSERLTPSAAALGAVAGFAGGVALAAAFCLLPPWIACAAGLAAGAAATLLLLFDAAFLGAYASRLTPLTIGIVAAAALASLAASRASLSMRWGWRAAAFAAIAATAIRLAVFLHPGSPIGDGMFHVHRAQAVGAGQYIFTSVTPRPFYEFPYPIGLYLAAQPFWESFPDRVTLLRGITLVTDALVAIALFAAAGVRWGPATGVAAAALALAVPVVTQSVSTANLTNVFGQSCFSLAIAWIVWSLSARRMATGAAGALALLSVAYLSHFSTAVIGVPAAVAIALAVALARDPAESRQWKWIAAAVAASMVLSYAIYYSRFHEVYARTWSRIGQEGADNSFVATLAEHSESKAVTVSRFLLANYGWGALLLAAIGIVTAVRRGWRDGGTLALGAAGIVCGGFLLLGAFTPVEMRANLAVHPIVACFAALGCVSLWTTERIVPRALVVLTLATTVWHAAAALRAVLVSV
jgi:hypothetical protein